MQRTLHVMQAKTREFHRKSRCGRSFERLQPSTRRTYRCRLHCCCLKALFFLSGFTAVSRRSKQWKRWERVSPAEVLPELSSSNLLLWEVIHRDIKAENILWSWGHGQQVLFNFFSTSCHQDQFEKRWLWLHMNSIEKTQTQNCQLVSWICLAHFE